MASISFGFAGPDSIEIDITGLEHPANQYDGFLMDVYRKVGSSYSYVGTSFKDGSTASSGSSTFINNGEDVTVYFGQTYGVKVYAIWNGEEFLINSGYFDISTTIPSAPTFFGVGFFTRFSGNELTYITSSVYGEISVKARWRVFGGDTYTEQTITKVDSTYTGTISGFSYNTSYYLSLAAYSQSGVTTGWSSEILMTTGSPPAPPVPSDTVDFTDRVESGFDLFWGSSSGATAYILDYKPSFSDTWTEVNVGNTTTYTLTGLSYGVTHDFKVKARNGSGDSEFTSVTSWTTAPKTPTISQGTVTSSSITVVAGSMSGNYDEIQILRYTSGSVYIDTEFVSAGESVTWSDLDPGVTYIFTARSKFFINDIDLYSVNFSSGLTITTSNRPTDFSWTYSTISSGANAVVDHRDWNALTSKIDEFRIYKGKGEYGFTTVTSGGDIYAWQFNQLVSSLTSDGSGGTQMTSYMTNNVMPSTKNVGDDFAAAYLLNIVTSLNSIT
jgi:hypothetical protein